MTLTQQEILNIIRKEITTKYEDIDFREGSLVYDLTSPLAYVVEKIFSVLEDLDQKFNILTASEEILKIWATPRIGTKYSGTYTRILVTGNDVSDSQWALTKDNNYTFTIQTVNENGSVWLKADQIGYIPISINDEVTSVNLLQKATITTIELGKDEETLENYRTRYLQSFLLESMAGTTNYIKNQLMSCNRIGYAGVDYETSSASTFQVDAYITNTAYRPIKDLDMINRWYNSKNSNTNITPWGQYLKIYNVGETKIDVILTIKNVLLSLPQEVVNNYFEQLRKTYYVPNLFNTWNLKYEIDVDDLRNKCSSQFTEYGTVVSVVLSKTTLNKSVPVWNNIEIKVEGS